MIGSVMESPITTEQELKLMLARLFYVQFSTNMNKDPKPAPFAPEWAYIYADMAIAYLGYDDEAINRLREDYK